MDKEQPEWGKLFDDLVLTEIPCLYDFKDGSVQDAMLQDARGKMKEFISQEREKAAREMLYLSPSEICMKYGLQKCHVCESEVCCDNTSPMKKRIESLEKGGPSEKRKE